LTEHPLPETSHQTSIKITPLHTLFLKPFVKDALVDRLGELDQQGIRSQDGHQEAVKLEFRMRHFERMLEGWDIRNDHRNRGHKTSQEHHGHRGARLNEGDFARPEEMDDVKLIQLDTRLKQCLRSHSYCFFPRMGYLTCVRAPSMNQVVCARET
jgi:hypothetical protein